MPQGSQGTQREELERARRELVSGQRRFGPNVQSFVDEQYARAYRPGASGDLTQVVQFVSYLLEGEGRQDDAIAEIDNALAIRAGDHVSVGHLLSLRAALLAGIGRLPEALESLKKSEALIAMHQPAEFSKWLVLTETARMQLMEDSSPRLQMLLAQQGPEAALDQLHLLCWSVPYLAARGDLRSARPHIRRIKAQLQLEPHAWRAEELRGFEAWLRVTASAAGPVPRGGINPIAGWRLASLELFGASMRRDAATAREARDLVARYAAASPATDFGPAHAWDAWLEASLGLSVSRSGLQPSRAVSLHNLGAYLAAANAVAIGGTPQEARVWLPWIKGLQRRGFESSLEWPVSCARMEALLELRCGNLQSARAAFHRSITWATEAGYSLEAQIAELQLQQITPSHGGDAGKAASEALLELGVDPLPHVYAARPQGSSRAAERSELTARELQVLQLLSEGRTYKSVAAALGVKWPTVQTTAHRIYEKLGVSGRHKAVEAAKRAGLL